MATSMLDAKLRARVGATLDAFAGDTAASDTASLLIELMAAIDEFELLHESVLEHSSELENELEQKSHAIEQIMHNMRRYLSKSLYERISGGSESTLAGATARRNLSIFFSDIVGFTELTDTVEPETLSQVLNTYLGCMTEICERHGGTVDKFIGDAIMIFFGDDEQSDPAKSARACVAMALEMQSATGALQSTWAKFGTHLGLRVRMGINSGYCTIGNFGSGERVAYTVVGGNVNVASRLEHQADPGGICISGSTYALVRDLVEVRPMGSLTVKGVAHPVETFAVTAAKQPSECNPWLQSDAEGFTLRGMNFQTKLISEIQRQTMRAALAGALERLDAEK
jgi:adenylate cyclase